MHLHIKTALNLVWKNLHEIQSQESQRCRTCLSQRINGEKRLQSVDTAPSCFSLSRVSPLQGFSLLKPHALDVFSLYKLLVWDGQLGSLLFTETPGGSLDKPCSLAAVPHTAAMAEAIKKGVKCALFRYGLVFFM